MLSLLLLLAHNELKGLVLEPTRTTEGSFP